MACGCKNKKGEESIINNEDKPKISLIKEIKNYTGKSIVFILSLLFIPIIMGVIIYHMFRTIVLTRELDILSFLFSLAKKMKKITDEENLEDDYDEDDFLDEEDLIMLNVEDITKKSDK